jgi:hypothetical protein
MKQKHNLARNDREKNNLTTAVIRQRSVNSKRGMVFSALSVPMAAQATMQYVMPPHGNN